ncbi:MAG: GNAT family N-acetyltransferase [Hyphomicrobiaceae bacterium]
MQISFVSTLEELPALETSWNALHAADPDASLFLSYAWMRCWLAGQPPRWFILVARDEERDDIVGLLPLRLRTRISRSGVLHNELTAAGSRMADYTGLLCRPAYERKVIPAFVNTILGLPWKRLDLECLRIGPQRLNCLVAPLQRAGLTVHSMTSTNPDGVDNLVCPVATLAGSFESYLSGLGSSTRQKLRRLLRRLDQDDRLAIRLADAETATEDIETVLALWRARWETLKGARTGSIVRNMRMLLRSVAADGILFLPVLRYEGRPVGALASIVDRRKKSLLFWIAGRDEQFQELSSGLLLHADSIRRAIAMGLGTYDFLRGNEPYKYLFGAHDEQIRHLVIERGEARREATGLFACTIPDALAIADRLAGAKRHRAALGAYRQIAASAPDCIGALKGMARLIEAGGDAAGADRIWLRVATLASDDPEAMLKLARIEERRGRPGEAIAIYRRLIARSPHLAIACGRLGDALASMCDWPAAADAYRKVTELRPDSQHARLMLGNAQFRAGERADGKSAELVDMNLAAADRLIEEGRADIAAGHFRMALLIEKHCVAAHIGLARIARSEGRAENARAHLHHAARLAGDSGTVAAEIAGLTGEQSAHLASRRLKGRVRVARTRHS